MLGNGIGALQRGNVGLDKENALLGTDRLGTSGGGDAQRKLCAAAVAQNPMTGTADQQGAAYANIKAACGAN